MKEIVVKSTLIPLAALFLCIATITICSAASGNECPVAIKKDSSGVITALMIESIVDTVTITGIKVNRDTENKLYDLSGRKEIVFPKTIKFANTLYVLTAVQNVREVDIHTDKGGWKLAFK